MRPLTVTDFTEQWQRGEPELSLRAVQARLRRLVLTGQLEELEKGQYIEAQGRTDYEPDPSKTLDTVARLLEKEFPFVEAIYWESAWLNLFLNHQRVTNCIFIDTEVDVSPYIFEVLRSSSQESLQGYNVFLKPDKVTAKRYVATSRNKIVVRNLRGQHMWQIYKGKKLAKIEKVLTDVWLDKYLLEFESGEKEEIVYEAAKRYLVHIGKVKQYARNRASRTQIERLVNIILEGKGVQHDDSR